MPKICKIRKIIAFYIVISREQKTNILTVSLKAYITSSVIQRTIKGHNATSREYHLINRNTIRAKKKSLTFSIMLEVSCDLMKCLFIKEKKSAIY